MEGKAVDSVGVDDKEDMGNTAAGMDGCSQTAVARLLMFCNTRSNAAKI
jgi:hypothetical protein